MSSVASNLVLLTASLAVCFGVSEVVARMALREPGISSLPLEEQLERSRLAEPIAIEGSTTVAGLIQPSAYDDVVYELKPNLRATFQGKPLETNPAGFRDRDYALEKPPGTFRIVGIGDSVMFGWGVRAEESYLAILEEFLTTVTGRPVEIINAAVPGYNTAMEVALFERKLQQFQPDLVVLHFVGNDFAVPLFMTGAPQDDGKFRSYFFDFLKTRWESLAANQATEGVLLDDLNQLDSGDRREVKKRYHYMLGQKGFRRALSRLSRVTKERNIPVVVISGSKRKSVRGIAVSEGFYYSGVRSFVDAYFAAVMPHADSKTRQELLFVSPRDSHPNALGHQLYAQALFATLAENSLVPGLTKDTPPPHRFNTILQQ